MLPVSLARIRFAASLAACPLPALLELHAAFTTTADTVHGTGPARQLLDEHTRLVAAELDRRHTGFPTHRAAA